MNNWNGLTEFTSVVETESFTSAAKRIGTSVAHVSRQISALEENLGVKLFNRTTRKVSVTEVGQLYYQHCRPLLDGLDEAQRAVTNLQECPTGKLHFTAPVAYGERVIVPLLSQFVNKYTNLQVNLELTNQKLDLLEEGYDLAIRLGKLEDSSLMAKKLTTRTLHTCAAPEYIKKHGQPYTLSELNTHNCLLGTLDYWRFSVNDKTKTVRVSGNIRCNSGPALLNAALMGSGIIQLPDYYVRDALKHGQLISLLDKYQPEKEGIWALYPQNRHLSPKVRLLIDHLHANLSDKIPLQI